jgi:PAS domain S-box-containing protein
MGTVTTSSDQYTLSLIEVSPNPLMAVSVEGKITDANKALSEIVGVPLGKLVGASFSDCFSEPQVIREAFRKVLKNGSITDIPLTLLHKKGKHTDVLFNASVYKDETDKVIGVIAIVRDIAEQSWATELRVANKELVYQNKEKEKRADELVEANKELAFQNAEKEKRAAELAVANKELKFQNNEKEKRAAELVVANKELAFQNDEKEKRAAELVVANKELKFQNKEKEKRAAELIVANKELAFQNDEKEKRAAELIVANKELLFQNLEKEKRAAELIIANKELVFQNSEKVKRAEELQIANYARSIIEASLDPLFTINLDGKITDLNKASVNIIGKSRKKLIGTDFFNYFTEPQKARDVYKKVFAKGFVVDYPLTIKNKVLTDVLFNCSVFKDYKGIVLGAVVVARDITEQKRIEKELTEAKVFAEQATKTAEEAKRKAESATRIAEIAVKAKQQFLSNMSHEIRTPMNAIIGFTKVVLKTDLSAKQKEYLHAIKLSGDALIVLINDILDLAKVDAGKMTFEQTPFKMALSISAMLHLFETKIQEKNLQLIKEYDSNIPEVLVGDPVRLHQIILNLVSNAVKFTTKGRITVTVRLLSEDNEKVTIEFAVSDTGIGIADDKIKKIFENFQQASSGTSRLFGGTGLGLAIAKQLVEAQRGTIAVKSVIDEGSTFSFTLSFLKTNEPAEIDTCDENLDIEFKNIRVLVVEDIALNQLLMKTLLDDFGFERDIAANGKIAIEKLKADAYDVILMDLQMPEMNGFEATEYIRKELKSNIPIIALTADVTTVDLAKCKAVGMNDYIAKPVDERLLYSKIVGLVKKPSAAKYADDDESNVDKFIDVKCTDLDYLMERTKSDPQLMMEMISLYLEQTPPLISAMHKGLKNKDWKLLHSAVHKLIPSFAIVGINSNFEIMAKKVQEYASAQVQSEGITELVNQIGGVCTKACSELKEEFARIKREN